MKKIKKVIDSWLNTFGYYKAVMPDGSAITEAELMEMFATYGENEMFLRYLRDICASDIRLYFMATNEAERNIIRGAHRRANHFISLIRKSNAKRKRGSGN